MVTSSSAKPADNARARYPWVLPALGLVAFHLGGVLAGDPSRLWLPGLGIGIALYSWLGPGILPWLAADLVLIGTWQGTPVVQVLADSLLFTLQILASWWMYHKVGRGSRWLDDPRSATVFLILVPGIIAACFAVAQAGLWSLLGVNDKADSFSLLLGILWLSRALGILSVLPALLVVVTPVLMRRGWLAADTSSRAWIGGPLRDWTWEELGETAGLCLCSAVLAYLLVWIHDPRRLTADWALWGLCLLFVVWTSMRQGLRGGCLAASLSALVALTFADALNIGANFFSPLQGNLLAQGSTALLVGAAAGWIRTNEMRYRHIVGRIPVVLYSARLPRPLACTVPIQTESGRPGSKPEIHSGPAIGAEAEVMLVSPTCQHVFGCPPSALLGPYTAWLDRIVPEDRELVIAALTQLCLQRQPVTCEYRIHHTEPAPARTNGVLTPPASSMRWVRDTLAPSHSGDGLLEGWEGVIEDITEQRALTLHVRRMTGMLQALVANLPTGVYFVQGPLGHPLLVNARARQLLGQREDLAAGLQHLTSQFRLRKPDGTEYPTEELPVCKALRLGVSCTANDIVVHRPDGRKVPLITWAAPIDLSNTGKPDAAVWVLEDLTALQQAEAARRESELRLRGIIEAMAEGVVVEDADGKVVDCNPAACAILAAARDEVTGRAFLASATQCVNEGGQPLDPELLPDRQVRRHGQPVRDQVLGFRPRADVPLRWLLVSSMPLPVGPQFGLNYQRARVVTTFADITASLTVAEGLRQSKERYEHLVESLPLVVLQIDRDLNITFLNRVTMRLTGYAEDELRAPGFWLTLVDPADRAGLTAALEQALRGEPGSFEFRLRTRLGQTKSVLSLLQPRPAEDCCTALIVDLTVQRHLERELQNAQRLDLVGRLASGTVHDFNNLLTVMIGISHIAKMQLPEEHVIQADLDRVIEAGEQAAHLAGQLLTFSRQRPLAQNAVDLNETVRQTLKLLRGVLTKAIQFDAELSSEPALVRGSETQLKQVLMNLCLNARDAMPSGGRLVVRVGSSASIADNGQAEVFLTVEDSGQGMNEEVRSHIFEAFYSTKEHGTGLGLAVVRQIVNEMGGRIEVSSTPGAGTRMELRFRVYEPSDVLEEQPA